MADLRIHKSVDQSDALDEDVVRLARMALAAGDPDVQPLLRKLARRHRADRPKLAAGLVDLLRESPVRGAALRRAAEGQPIDVDSKAPLVREEIDPQLDTEPVMSEPVRQTIKQVVDEHHAVAKLAAAGLSPTRTCLFVGPPGVGKTLSARWMASQLNLPLLTLDLSSVMSSYLGRTGDNVRRVMNYAKSKRCILLLDELDAVAKRRDDTGEIGELKRLVTVLLQEVDYWPQGSLLVAATNHQELLDPAIWRRFEVLVDFPMPGVPGLSAAARQYLHEDAVSQWIPNLLGLTFKGSSFSKLEQEVARLRRKAALSDTTIEREVITAAREHTKNLASPDRIALAIALVSDAKLSQRQAQEVTGVSRDTIRKRIDGTSSKPLEEPCNA